MNDFDRAIEDDARRDIEDKTVAEQRPVKRGKTSVAIDRGYFERIAHQFRPRVERRHCRAEPDARRQWRDRRELRSKPPVDQHQPVSCVGEYDTVKLRRGYATAGGGRRQRRLFERA